MPKFIDETGNIYGDLTVVSRAENHINPSGKPRVQWNCICTCGNTCVVMGESLRNGRTKSCGKCDRRKRNSEAISDKVTQEMIGQIYGYLKVLEASGYETDAEGKQRRKVKCQCLLCGKEIEVRTNRLKNGIITSCGNHNHSRGELYVESFLQSIGCQFQKEYTFSDLKDKKKLRFDFVIFNYNKPCGCIEVQGRQHYDTNNGWYNPDVIIHDKMKQQYCNENNIPLLILNYQGQEKENFSTWDNQIRVFLQGVNNDKTS